MAFVPAANTVRATLEFVWGGQIVAITVSVRKLDGWDFPDYEQLKDHLENWWNTNLKPGLSTGIGLQKINVLDLNSSSAPSVEFPISPISYGGNPNASVPLNSAIVTSFKTPLRGRSYRGRAYMPGLTISSLLNPGVVTSAFAASLVTSWLALVTLLTGSGMEHVVVSRVQEGVELLSAVVTGITEYFVEQNLDSQRRRLVGRGS